MHYIKATPPRSGPNQLNHIHYSYIYLLSSWLIISILKVSWTQHEYAPRRLYYPRAFWKTYIACIVPPALPMLIPDTPTLAREWRTGQNKRSFLETYSEFQYCKQRYVFTSNATSWQLTDKPDIARTIQAITITKPERYVQFLGVSLRQVNARPKRWDASSRNGLSMLLCWAWALLFKYTLYRTGPSVHRSLGTMARVGDAKARRGPDFGQSQTLFVWMTQGRHCLSARWRRHGSIKKTWRSRLLEKPESG